MLRAMETVPKFQGKNLQHNSKLFERVCIYISVGRRPDFQTTQQKCSISVCHSSGCDVYENKGRLLCAADGTSFELFERIKTIGDAQQIQPRTSSRSGKNDDFDLFVDNELGFAKEREPLAGPSLSLST